MSILYKFIGRHIGPSSKDVSNMLKTVGYSNINSFVKDIIPKSILYDKELESIPKGTSEIIATNELKQHAMRNINTKSFIGQGYYGTLTPPVIKRNLIENPGWYTSYTPYQPEISQGRLEMLLNFQTLITELTSLPISNASLLDEASSAGEAMSMCFHHFNKKKNNFLISKKCHPQTIELLKTRATGLHIKLVFFDTLEEFYNLDLSEACGVIIQYPNTYGHLENNNDLKNLSDHIHSSNSLLIAACDPLALTLFKPPGEWGADIAVGSMQRFGVPLFFGGPHAGYIACSEEFKRKLPGRIIGVSKDKYGDKANRLALQAREQHIRRDKATSNICTAQALLANIAASYSIYHGPKGLQHIAGRVAGLTQMLKDSLPAKIVKTQTPFDTLVIEVECSSLFCAFAEEENMNFRYIDDIHVGISFDETTTIQDVQNILNFINDTISSKGLEIVPPQRNDFCKQLVFNTHHTETNMMRYLKSLENKDLTLNRAMIPLGSCTMKLNSVSELEPILWDNLCNIHPFAPENQTYGWLKIINQLHTWLQDITGFDEMWSQPNSGATGEYSGLTAIRQYHESIGEHQRKICLIPNSAHGTNPASAIMAGLKVVVIKTCDDGTIDLDDLDEKIEKYKYTLSSIMVTYPSTYGVYESNIKTVCSKVHEAGGQVYMDGANMNAQVGLTNPRFLGADVCHLNLHKTFAIPHGGGGPGVGTIGVVEQLAPFLNKMKVAAAPYGSAGILPISWMYIRMLGRDGLLEATKIALLNANYMMTRLKDHYKIVFKGENGLCAHEFILDLRQFKEFGVTEEDVAKRLIDYGFHAPTMSWPVPGTLMIEPTESEDKEELDRFVDAMIQIRDEIQDIIEKRVEIENSPLRNAPHTIKCIQRKDLHYDYLTAAYPMGYTTTKFWPSVSRVDSVAGDRNLVCTCDPIEDYE